MLRDDGIDAPGSDANDGYDSLNQGQEINPDPGIYDSAEDSGYESANQDNFKDPGIADQAKRKKLGLIEQAKRNVKRGRAFAQRTVPKMAGNALGDKHLFKYGDEANRERAKEFAEKNVRKFAKDKIAKKIGDKGLRVGFEKGLSRTAGKATKEGAKRLGKEAGKQLGKATAKGAGQAATKGLQGAVTAGGAATGVETFGLGFLLALLLNIAISLGISDAVDSLFELKDGNFRRARFLAIRAATKVGMFIILLVDLIVIFSGIGIFLAGPVLFGLNVYMLLGYAFPNIAIFQGFVWWEKLIIIILDVFAAIILLTFLMALGWYLCGGTDGVGVVAGAIFSFYDWWNKTSVGSVAADFCQYVNISGAVPAVTQ